MRWRAFALLAVLVALALSGCGGGEESPQPANDQPGTTTQTRDYGY